MRSRYNSITALLVLVGLSALGAYYWFAWTPYARFKSEQLEVISALSTGRSGGSVLTVGFNNRSSGDIQIMKSSGLRGAFSVLLVNAQTRREVPRLPSSLNGPAGAQMMLRPRKQLRWNVGLSELYGELEPGDYVIRVTYDTEAARERGEEWAEGLGIGKSEGSPIRFTIEDKRETGE